METLKKLEHTIAGWFKKAPDMPKEWRVWLGNNIWWVAIIGVVSCALATIGMLGVLFGSFALFGAVVVQPVASTVVAWGVVHSVISLIFIVGQGALLLAAIQPLKAKYKRGWVLLFAAFLLSALSVAVNSVLSLSVVDFISSILAGVISLGIGGYILFQMHGEFAHNESKKTLKKADEAAQK